MPHIAPLTKISSCQELGARVVLHGAHILEAREKADEFAKDEVRWLQGSVFIGSLL
jgi:threonine dehydratase